jgi:hypothetical protein
MYTTDEKVKDFYSNELNSTEIKQIIKSISDYMDKLVGYKLASKKSSDLVDIYFDGSGTKYVDFGSTWISEFDKVFENDIDITDNVLAYPLNKPFKNYIAKRVGTFGKDIGSIKLSDARIGAFTIDWNGDDHSFPHDLELACKTLVVSVIKFKENKGVRVAGDVTQEKTSQYSISYGSVNGEKSGDVIEAIDIINRYKDFFLA